MRFLSASIVGQTTGGQCKSHPTFFDHTAYARLSSGLRFTEGFDTRDLKEAKALLEELAA
jgi:hypothetical protein